MAGEPSLSVIVVAYRSSRWIGTCINAVRRAAERADRRAEFIVVDNASPDDSAAIARALPDVTVIENVDNVGFGRACNQAFDVATGDYWLLVNPDATLEASALGPLLDLLAHDPQAGAAAPSLVATGDRAESAGMLPSIRSLLGHYFAINRLPMARGAWMGFQILHRPGRGPVRVSWVSAATVLLRPEAVRAVGAFDPNIFLYGEDIDLCDRLGRAGWGVWLVDTSRAVHAIGGSEASVSTRWVDGLIGWYERRAGRWRTAAFGAVLALGLGLRALVDRRSGNLADTHRGRMRSGAARAFELTRRVALSGGTRARR